MALVDQIVQALEALGGHARYSDLYAYWEKTLVHPYRKTGKIVLDEELKKIHLHQKLLKESKTCFILSRV